MIASWYSWSSGLNLTHNLPQVGHLASSPRVFFPDAMALPLNGRKPSSADRIPPRRTSQRSPTNSPGRDRRHPAREYRQARTALDSIRQWHPLRRTSIEAHLATLLPPDFHIESTPREWLAVLPALPQGPPPPNRPNPRRRRPRRRARCARNTLRRGLAHAASRSPARPRLVPELQQLRWVRRRVPSVTVRARNAQSSEFSEKRLTEQLKARTKHARS